MSFVVSEDCLRLGLRAGAIAFRGVRVGPAGPDLRAAIAAAVAEVRSRYASPAAVRALPELAAFREVLRRAGADPRKEQSSVERLLLLALKRGELPAVNSLVDAYNLVSVRTRCSLGAHDLDRIAPPVTLRLLTGAETFTPLGSDTAVSVTKGEFGYVDAADRLLCRLDVRQAELSKVTEQARNVLLIVEGNAAHTADVLRRAFAEVTEQVARHCGGTAEVVALPGAPESAFS
jgi:DNA/RNA-binding domain of Phe-tRNA-synthetase-like protein